MRLARFLILLSLIIPANSFAAVNFSEIAWMGSTLSQYDEWIELYNDSNQDLNLAGSKIYEEGGKTLIAELSGQIPANGFYLIKRVTGSFANSLLPGQVGILTSFGGSGLKNLPGGEFLVLKDKEGNILDSFDASLGWPAGDSATKQTMQKISGKWVTATSTPGAINIDFANIDNNDGDKQTNQTSDPNISAHSGGAVVSDTNRKQNITIGAGRERIALVNSPIVFQADAFDGDSTVDNGIFSWNFGDGSFSYGKLQEHLYDLPGQYVVVLNANIDGQSFVSRTKVKVFAPEFELSVAESQNQKYISVENLLSTEVNLGGWKLSVEGKTFTIPNDTIILAKSKLSFSSKITNLDIYNQNKVALLYPTGAIFEEIIFQDKKDKQTKNQNHEVIVQLSYSSSTTNTASVSDDIAQKLAEIKDNLLAMSLKVQPSNSLKKIVTVEPKVNIAPAPAGAPVKKVIVIGEKKTEKSGFLNFLITTPENSLRFIKNLFF